MRYLTKVKHADTRGVLGDLSSVRNSTGPAPPARRDGDASDRWSSRWRPRWRSLRSPPPTMPPPRRHRRGSTAQDGGRNSHGPPTPGQGEAEPLGVPPELDPMATGPFIILARQSNGAPAPTTPAGRSRSSSTSAPPPKAATGCSESGRRDRQPHRAHHRPGRIHRRGSRRRPGGVPTERYGDRWAPVLVAWTDPEEFGEVAGVARRR